VTGEGQVCVCVWERLGRGGATRGEQGGTGGTVGQVYSTDSQKY
jgi:hypothetical protein